jgi:uncharacterized protein
MNSFELNVSDLRRSRASERDVEIDAAVDWALELSRVEPDPEGGSNLQLDLTLTPVGGGMMVSGEARFVARHSCHRCLEEWTEQMAVPVSAMFSPRASEDDEGMFLLTDNIDLETPMRDDVLLAMPLLPTCPDGCKAQLVGPAENGLNTSGSAEDGSVEDVPEGSEGEGSPFAALRDLLEPGD